jgi:uncharacterized repeat protein (TIGR03803 family)
MTCHAYTPSFIRYSIKKREHSFLNGTRIYFLSLFLLLISIYSFSQDVLMGLTSNGGAQGKGTAFTIKTNGTGFTVVNGFADWGKNPNGGLVQGADGNYYGMTNSGGTFSNGATIFKITPAGVLTVVHQFVYATDGGFPFGNLVKAADGNFYGLTSAGGSFSGGTIFKLTPAGVFTVLKHFNSADGIQPHGQLAIGTDGNFYGVTYRGGANGFGTIFKLTTTGVYSVLKSLTFATDGGYALGSLVRASDGNFYGITSDGGTNGDGTIFKVTPTGVYTVLRHLKATTDGGSSRSNLVQAADGFLYGMNYAGGTHGTGVIFKISTSGTFTVLRNLTLATDGGYPFGTMIVGTDGSLYGTNSAGGVANGGTIFKMTTAGVYTVLKALTLATDGGTPKGSLFKGSDGNYYGLNSDGGSNLFGTAFKISATGTYTVLTRFNGGLNGGAPLESLIQATDNAFYGTTSIGGTTNTGTVFKICGGNTTVLYSFKGSPQSQFPKGSLVQASDGNFYGLAAEGGTSGGGIVFKITSTGVFTVLHNFVPATEGRFPLGSLIIGSDNYLYGMTSDGGTNAAGTIFKISTTGTFKVIRQLVPATDGKAPEGGLVKGLDSNMYGMTKVTPRIFKISPNGAFTVLKTLTATTDGSSPLGSLVLGKDGLLYGTCSAGGSFNRGTIFKITTAGAYSVLKHLNLTPDGAVPNGNLVQAADGFFYGMTSTGGTNNAGTIFKISTAGVYTVLRHLNILTDGGNPFGSLIIQKPNTLVATPQTLTTAEDVAKAITLTGSGGSPLTFSVVTQPKNGTITSGTAAARTYTPKANFNGKDSFYFTANVGCLASPPAKVLITVTQVNDSPVLAPIGNKTAKVGVKLTFTATATDVDAGQTKTFSLITPPAGATIGATTGVFSWTPTAAGSFTFKVRVTDNGSPVKFDEEQITVTVAAALTETGRDVGVTEKILMGKVDLYPNPVKSSFMISMDRSFEKVTVTLTDVQGAIVRNWSMSKVNNQQMKFNVDRLAKGEYILRLNTENGSRVFKFLKL